MSEAPVKMEISKLGQVAIRVRDIHLATTFYRDVLGLPFLFTTGKLSFFDCAGVRLMLTLPEKAEFDHPGSILYFTVADIRSAHQQMLGKKVRFEDEPHMIARMPAHDLWMCFFRDSEDNVLALMSEVPRKA